MGPGYPDPRYARHLSTPQASITKEVWTHGGIVGRKRLGPLMGMGGSNGDPFLSLSPSHSLPPRSFSSYSAFCLFWYSAPSSWKRRLNSSGARFRSLSWSGASAHSRIVSFSHPLPYSPLPFLFLLSDFRHWEVSECVCCLGVFLLFRSVFLL
jgi:hypothetical protein